jgi:hypothetical protein
MLISGFRREINENCALLGHYAASSGNFLTTFWDNLSIPSSQVKNPSWILDPLKMGIGFSEKLIISYHHLLCNNPEERNSQLLRLSATKL